MLNIHMVSQVSNREAAASSGRLPMLSEIANIIGSHISSLVTVQYKKYSSCRRQPDFSPMAAADAESSQPHVGTGSNERKPCDDTVRRRGLGVKPFRKRREIAERLLAESSDWEHRNNDGKPGLNTRKMQTALEWLKRPVS